MKKRFFCTICVALAGIASLTTLSGAELSTTCPDGSVMINQNGLSIFDGTCPAGMSRVARGIKSCLVETGSPNCFLYAPAGSDFTNASGTLQYSALCPYTPTARCLAFKACLAYGSSAGFIDWIAVCSGGIGVVGQGVCASVMGPTMYGKLSSLTSAGTEASKTFCWCRMTTPAVSKWVYTAKKTDAISCGRECANDCAQKLQSDTLFRSAITSDLEGS